MAEPSKPPIKLVYASVAFYQGLKAGEIGEVPTEIADNAIAGGFAVEVDSLEARVKVTRPSPPTSVMVDVPPEIVAARQSLLDDTPPRSRT